MLCDNRELVQPTTSNTRILRLLVGREVIPMLNKIIMLLLAFAIVVIALKVKM